VRSRRGREQGRAARRERGQDSKALGKEDNEDEEARATRLANLRRRLLALVELCRDSHSDDCVVDASPATR
jgi:hypothetical protein